MKLILTISPDQHKVCKPEPQKSTEVPTSKHPYKQGGLTTTYKNSDRDLHYKLSSTKVYEL
jgi:hypothetical protein